MEIIEQYNVAVTSDGDVINVATGRVLKHQVCRNGYHRIGVTVNGKRKMLSVHRLVAMAFLDKPEGMDEVNHIDGNKSNNHRSNLEWSNRLKNMRHAHNTGLIPEFRVMKKPERNAEMIALKNAGMPYREIGEKFGISWFRVRIIYLRETNRATP